MQFGVAQSGSGVQKLGIRPTHGVYVDQPYPAGGDPVYFNRPGVALVTWNPDLKAACIESQGWTDTGQGQAALDAVIRALRAHRGSRCLVDGRKTKVKLQNWLPRALGAGLKLAAVVQPASDVGRPNVDDMARLADNQVAVRYFSTVENAARWLTAPPATRA